MRDRADAIRRVCPGDPAQKEKTHRVAPHGLWPFLLPTTSRTTATTRRPGKHTDCAPFQIKAAHTLRDHPTIQYAAQWARGHAKSVPFRCRHSHVSSKPSKTAPHGACRQEQGQCRDAPRRHTGGVRVQPTLYIRLRGAESYRVVGDRKVRNRRRSRFLRSRSRPVAAWSPLQEVPPGLYRDR